MATIIVFPREWNVSCKLEVLSVLELHYWSIPAADAENGMARDPSQSTLLWGNLIHLATDLELVWKLQGGISARNLSPCLGLLWRRPFPPLLCSRKDGAGVMGFPEGEAEMPWTQWEGGKPRGVQGRNEATVRKKDLERCLCLDSPQTSTPHFSSSETQPSPSPPDGSYCGRQQVVPSTCKCLVVWRVKEVQESSS